VIFVLMVRTTRASSPPATLGGNAGSPKHAPFVRFCEVVASSCVNDLAMYVIQVDSDGNGHNAA